MPWMVMTLGDDMDGNDVDSDDVAGDDVADFVGL
jgi:hypothetical protein